MAFGILTAPIVLASRFATTDTNCFGMAAVIDNDEAEPGVSRDSSLRHVSVRAISLELNGGTIENSVFNSGTCTTGGRGRIEKSGLDLLTIRNNTFNPLGSISIAAGNETTRILNNTGCISGLNQSGSQTTGTIVSNNSFTACDSTANGPWIQIGGGTIQFSANTFQLNSGNLIFLTTSVSTAQTYSNLNVSGAGCRAVASATSGSLTLDKAQINCQNLLDLDMSDTAPITVTRSTVNVSKTLVRVTSLQQARSFTIRKSDITCIGASGANQCDLVHIASPSNSGQLTLALTDNIIRCDSSQNCRGGLNLTRQFGGFTTPITPTLTYSFAGSWFVGRPLNSALTSNIIQERFDTGTQESIWQTDPTEIKIYEYDFNYPSSYINANYTITGSTATSAPTVGPNAPTP